MGDVIQLPWQKETKSVEIKDYVGGLLSFLGYSNTPRRRKALFSWILFRQKYGKWRWWKAHFSSIWIQNFDIARYWNTDQESYEAIHRPNYTVYNKLMERLDATIVAVLLAVPRPCTERESTYNSTKWKQETSNRGDPQRWKKISFRENQCHHRTFT